MSAGISPSGVASLRARFEQKDESTSPPSRGRSPAGSLSDASRPISKVRTSFIAVEPSGRMADIDASGELGNKGHALNGDGAGDSTTDREAEKPKTNGVDLSPQMSIKKEENTPEQMVPKRSPGGEDSTSPEDPGTMNSVPPAAHPDKPYPNAEDMTAARPPLDAKEVDGAFDGNTREGETSPLGSILKGSPFEQDANKGDASNTRETGATAKPVQSSEQQTANPSTPMTNGKPKEAPASNSGVQSKTKTSPRPSETRKKSAAQLASSTRGKSENKPETSTFPAPTTPKNAATPSKQPVSKKISPKSAALKETKKEALRDTEKPSLERLSRPSVAPKALLAASKPPAKPAKAPGPRSPPYFAKPRPRSPTRPVRLSGSATAPTAASAAKIDAAPAATAKPRDRVPSNPISLRQKSARASLPAGSKPTEKTKEKPKSRLSTASSRPSEGSFLDRMMRPTQSSSQKTHEKVEAKTPPKKTNGVRPKRKSDASEKATSEKAKSEKVETKEEQSIETAPTPQASANPKETPMTNGGNNGIEEDAPTEPLPMHWS